MREARTALARLFTNLALITIPDGIPVPYTCLLQAQELLKQERIAQKGEGQQTDQDIRDFLTIAAGAQFGFFVGFVLYASFAASVPWEAIACLLGAVYSLATAIYFFKEGR